MSRFLTTDLGQLGVEGLDFEVLLRTAVFKSTNQLMGYLFQKHYDRCEQCSSSTMVNSITLSLTGSLYFMTPTALPRLRGPLLPQGRLR